MINPALLIQYDIWMKKYPDNINIPLSAGTVFQNAAMPQAKDFLLKAAEIDPKNSKVWSMLSADAKMRGQDNLSAEYSKKAALADPSNAVYAYVYLTSFESGHRDTYNRKLNNKK